jgi:membrane fusion protein (multidrug efflux system)
LVRASIDGNVGDKTVRVGQFVQPGTAMMTVVPVQNIYLVANFKETQRSRMRAGQPATIKVDALGGKPLRGVVESFSPGTGAQFALFPPNNATGNFTKVVQRIPTRIRIDAGPEARKVLAPGLSATVSVDTYGAGADQ